jgi:hypothetical protein
MNAQPSLSILELNRIAAEFGVQFMINVTDEEPTVSLHSLSSADLNLYKVGPVLADKCEAEGSRWCEPIRKAVAAGYYAFVIPMEGYTLTDWRDATELHYRYDPPEFDIYGG